MEIDSKECIKCHRVKPLDSFLGNSNSKDGRMHACAKCKRAAARRRAKRKWQDRHESDPVELTEPEVVLADWWRGQAEAEIDQTVAKAIEYGANDLIEIGRALAYTQERDCNPQELAEMGIYFYLIGKVARWTAAMAEGRQVSDDTLLDIGVYVRMAQRVRQAGAWPGV